MSLELTKQQTDEAIASLRRYFRHELEQELPEMQARFLLDYFAKEIAPYAYNRGVRDAEAHMRATMEDLSAVCFEEELGYWRGKKA